MQNIKDDPNNIQKRDQISLSGQSDDNELKLSELKEFIEDPVDRGEIGQDLGEEKGANHIQEGKESLQKNVPKKDIEQFIDISVVDQQKKENNNFIDSKPQENPAQEKHQQEQKNNIQSKKNEIQITQHFDKREQLDEQIKQKVAYKQEHHQANLQELKQQQKQNGNNQQNPPNIEIKQQQKCNSQVQKQSQKIVEQQIQIQERQKEQNKQLVSELFKQKQTKSQQNNTEKQQPKQVKQSQRCQSEQQIKKQNKKKKKKKTTSNKNSFQTKKQVGTDSLLNISTTQKTDHFQPSSNQISLPSIPISIAQQQQTINMKQIKKQRIQTTLTIFLEYTNTHKFHTNAQKSVLTNLHFQISTRKSKKYVWYHHLKQYLNQYQDLCKSFHEISYNISKEQATEQKNQYINMGEELRESRSKFYNLKKQIGNNYNYFSTYIENKIDKQLQIAFNKAINEINLIDSKIDQKKKTSEGKQNQFNKQMERIIKMLHKQINGYDEVEDIFVQTCKFIKIEKQFKECLILWGKSIVELKICLSKIQIQLNQDIQYVLNLFKNTAANLYSFHEQTFDRILNSSCQVDRQNQFSKFCSLTDADYIKFTIKKVTTNTIKQLQLRHIEYFVEMHHLEVLTGKNSNLLKSMITKQFQLKQPNEYLLITTSDNIIYYNKQKLQYLAILKIKNVSGAIISEGVIQFDEIIPKIIFNNHRTLRFQFKDRDRADQIICLLNLKKEGEIGYY